MEGPTSIFKTIFDYKSIAVVGISPKPDRPSHYVSLYMEEQGYNIIPVNPGQDEIRSAKCYASLLDISEKIEVVNVFRRSEHVVPIAEHAIKIGAKALWLQDGVINEEAKVLAEAAGLLVVMNDCMLRQHRQIFS